MGRGPKKHMKRLAAPKNWCLAKLGGIYAPHPSSGPHKIRESIPIILILRNKLKYALTYDEAKMIAHQRLIKIDGKVRTDIRFPCGFQDVVSIDKSGEMFRVLYDVKGRFVLHKIDPIEAKYKLCRIQKVQLGLRGIMYATTHDGRTIRFIHPNVKKHDTVRFDFETGQVKDFIKFEPDSIVMVTGGHNIGRVGKILKIERHPGSVDIVHIEDASNKSFATRVNNVFVIGEQDKCWISLPKHSGIRKTIIEERELRLNTTLKE